MQSNVLVFERYSIVLLWWSIGLALSQWVVQPHCFNKLFAIYHMLTVNQILPTQKVSSTLVWLHMQLFLGTWVILFGVFALSIMFFALLRLSVKESIGFLRLMGAFAFGVVLFFSGTENAITAVANRSIFSSFCGAGVYMVMLVIALILVLVVCITKQLFSGFPYTNNQSDKSKSSNDWMHKNKVFYCSYKVFERILRSRLFSKCDICKNNKSSTGNKESSHVD